MGDYFKVCEVEGLRRTVSETSESDKSARSYFKWLKVVGTGKESSPISHLSLSPCDNLCAVSYGTKVLFYDYMNQNTLHNYTSSKSFVRFCSFRSDAKLAAVSDDSGSINVIALSLKSHLRRFNAHEGPVHCHRFSNDKLNLMSGGEDSRVKFWDISEEKCVLTLDGHTDSVRTLCSIPDDPNLWVTGCYDSRCRVYDVRIPTSPVATLNHGSPVQHVSCSSSGFRLLSTGDNKVMVWDVSSGLKLDYCLKPHMRTVLGSFLSDEDECLVTASLDGTVKFTDVTSGTLLQVYSYESQITSFDFLYNSVLTVGLVSGDWLVRHNLKAGDRMINEPDTKASDSSPVHQGSEAKPLDYFGYKPPKLGPLDKLVKSFQYKAALDLALKLTPEHVYNLIELLIIRGTLSTAVRNRDEKTILPLLKFVCAHLNRDINNTTLILEFLIAILDQNPWLKSCTDEAVMAEIKRIPNKINLELYQHTILMRLKGLIDFIL
ncbi:uncharacterized protein TOT_010000973 [Theileria orientalis strain Shintoku]|uniref:U3 small nucleolar RNA-associated protein 15 C-terminal domain-containing protein n=1 Tax=Theileria orientalis strain Shintoku TaxID=869250 RepID=J4C7R9_THEOR|nr:uncharacterized protein TOT_010000973 [Theileria orientalis strain Shintoku]PVC50478.1 hypothetical protein MACL_00002257 [Theileria orientalis]BAM39518.1 uncharacterized protein TOT_010000973 [Theileria orientalis strain Shintoku]|eukprot:XP_009689819.1 uncharacterized protein TOT_010000973 [Theileria orientalis strain Shintoku]